MYSRKVNYSNYYKCHNSREDYTKVLFEGYTQTGGTIPSWFGFNVMPDITGQGKGYTINCMEKLLQEQGFLNLRNPLSSFLYNQVHDGNKLYQKDVLDFCTNRNTTLYTCLEWGGLDSNSMGRQDVDRLKQSIESGIRITHIQINQGNFAGTPLPISTNPTEDPLCELPGFDGNNYIQWLDIVNDRIPMKTNAGDDIVFVIPFRWSGSGPSESAIKSPCFNNIMNKLKELEQTTHRVFGLESSMYPFWFGAHAEDPTPVLAQRLIDTKQSQVTALKETYNMNRLDFILTETGWPNKIIDANGNQWNGNTPLPFPYCGGEITPSGSWTPQFVPDANIEKAKKWFNAVLQYKPSDTNFKLYYWQLQDANNGDGCGKTWGILDDECNIIGKSGGITPSPPAPPRGSWQPCSGGICCNPYSDPIEYCPGGIRCEECGGALACQCPP